MKEKYVAHVLAVPYPSQGHICPMLQFCKFLVSRGVKASFAITNYISNTLNPKSDDDHLRFVAISDGYDEGGFMEAKSIADYLARLESVGSLALDDAIELDVDSQNPITCVVYDAFLPWGSNVAKKYGLKGAAFFTQACGVNYVYYLIHHGKLSMPINGPWVDVPGLPQLGVDDLPSFVVAPESYPAYLQLVLNQNSNVDAADYVLVNTVYELEDKVVDAMSKECPLLTIGPTIPSYYLDKQRPWDKTYGLDLFHLDPTPTTNWLSTKPPSSVIYVSFGSMACLPKDQMQELALSLKESAYNFLWVVRACEEAKLPKEFVYDTSSKGLIVRWTPQLEVLANEAIGCFLTHCGWNSTLEALVMGVPMIGMPQWTDQPLDAKLIEDVWKVGIRVKVNGNGLVEREEIGRCIVKVMDGETRGELVENGKKWKGLVKEAICQGGSSYRNIDKFINNISNSLVGECSENRT